MGQRHRLDGDPLVGRLRQWAHELGFSQIGVAGIDLAAAEPGLRAWLDAGWQGSMHYMALHGMKRARPAELVPGTVSVITARMDYLPRGKTARSDNGGDGDGDIGENWIATEQRRVAEPQQAVVSIYARGRDYHKVLRNRLQTLADRLAAEVGPFGHRVFTDSAPVLEAELATRSGIGWRGKHTLALHREAGSMFFLGELFIDFELPATAPVPAHCGSCRACIDICPTQAIVTEGRLDARRCISYLTIEHDGPIPHEFRRAIGNRIYGCDDCQTACPWNKFAQRSVLPDFDVREGLDQATLLELWAWSEPEFLQRTQGSAIGRIGWQRWRRNLAVGLGNALRAADIGAKRGAPLAASVRAALTQAQQSADALVAEHIEWALSAAD